MDGSILNTIIEMHGPDDTYSAFNTDLIVFINSTLATMNQVGVGVEGFTISGAEEQWNDFIPDDPPLVNMAKEYVYLKVRAVFDPPTNSFVLDYMKDKASELEWRMNIYADEWA